MIEPELLEQYKFASRFQKASKIERVLLDHLGTQQKVRELRCLDLGCSIGVISTHLADVFGQVVGVEPLSEAVDIACRLYPHSKATFLRGDGQRLPFQDEAFDVIVCAQVYEHSTQPYLLVKEIWRTLRPGGSCFFSGPNRLWPFEYHYDWWFIHWLPRTFLHWFCQRRYGHLFDLVLYNYWQLRELWQDFECHDYTLRLVYEPGRFLEHSNSHRWARMVPRFVATILRPFLPNFNWVLVKKAAPTHV
jgi:2-polyprenyl-3-methyl-5-hydroxy-6-metoxy-1,4-benzoquinol methylase